MDHPGAITATPRIRLLPEDNVRKGFAEAKQVETACKRLKGDVGKESWFPVGDGCVR